MQPFIRRPGFAPIGWVAPLLVVTLLGLFGWRLRDGRFINEILELNPRCTSAWCPNRGAQRATARCAAHLDDVRRLVLPDPLRVPAYLLNRPFQLIPLDEGLPLDLGSGDMLWLEVWSRAQQQQYFTALERYGFPELVSPPAVRSFGFRGESRPGARVNVALDPRRRLEAIHVGESLDRQRW